MSNVNSWTCTEIRRARERRFGWPSILKLRSTDADTDASADLGAMRPVKTNA